MEMTREIRAPDAYPRTRTPATFEQDTGRAPEKVLMVWRIEKSFSAIGILTPHLAAVN